MKQILVIVSALFATTFAFAEEQPAQPAKQIQVICAEQAVQAAAMLFQLNTKLQPTDHKVEIVDLAHVEEGGYEVYDVIFTAGELTYSAYRVTTELGSCQIISFEMPFAN